MFSLAWSLEFLLFVVEESVSLKYPAALPTEVSFCKKNQIKYKKKLMKSNPWNHFCEIVWQICPDSKVSVWNTKFSNSYEMLNTYKVCLSRFLAWLLLLSNVKTFDFNFEYIVFLYHDNVPKFELPFIAPYSYGGC